jgi:hypothetical protein
VVDSLFFAIFAFVLCFIDVLCIGFAGQALLHSLLCLYATTLFTHKKLVLSASLLVLLATQAVMMGYSFNVQLVVIALLSLMGMRLQALFRETSWLPYLFIIGALAIPLACNPNLPLFSSRGFLFVLTQICVNLVILILFEKTLSRR